MQTIEIFKNLHAQYNIHKYKMPPYRCIFWAASTQEHIPFDGFNLGISGENPVFLQDLVMGKKKTVLLQIKDEWEALYLLKDYLSMDIPLSLSR